jgi:hypothetical protein
MMVFLTTAYRGIFQQAVRFTCQASIVAFAVLTVCATARAADVVTAGPLRVEYTGGDSLSVRTDLSDRFLRSLSLTVFDGRAKVPVELAAPRVASNGASMSLSYSAVAGLSVGATLRPVNRCVVLEISVANRRDEPAWLEFGPRIAIACDDRIGYFDGWDDHDAPKASVVSDRIKGTMPLAAAWCADASVGVGLEPSQLVSYFRAEFDPDNGAGELTASLGFVVRSVVDPGASETIGFVVACAPGEWGKYELFEAYYDSFPSWFSPSSEVDSRASLGSSQYRAWPAGRWSEEICRRLYGGWEWCYAPFRRTGDIVGRAELWDYEPARPFGKTRGMPRNEYLQWRRKAFEAGDEDANVAMMFYIPAQIWCEETLARERYADALTTDPKQRTYFDTPWVTGHDNELRVFPYGTSFEEQSHRDMRLVAESLPVSGFAFDTAGGTARYTGPALDHLEHKAWSEDIGVYCSELVAVAKLMDFVHTLRRDGKALAVVANPMPTGSYASCFHCDSAMIERNPWKHGRTEADRLRWKMGHKTLVWWEGYDVSDFVDTKSIAPDALARVYEGLADFTVLQSFRIGYIPTPNFTQGVARLVRRLPAIVEYVQSGWQPVPAVRVPEPLWSSRYGRGLGTLVAVAHETGSPVRAAAEIENSRLGSGVFLFAPYDGGVLENRVERGNTIVDLDVPVRTPVLLRSALSLEPASAVRGARLATRIDLSESLLDATVRGAGAVHVRIRCPADMHVASVRVDDRPVSWGSAEKGVCEGDVALAGESRVQVRFASDVFDLADSALLAFPFAIDGAPACVLRPEPAAEVAVRRAALRIRQYIEYWYGRAITPRSEVVLPIVDNAAPVDVPAVVCRIQSGAAARVYLSEGNLIIEAGGGRALETLVGHVQRALDTRYWTPELFPVAAVRERLAERPPALSR